MIPLNWLKLNETSINKVKFIPNRNDYRGDILIEFNEGKVYRYKDVPGIKIENMIYNTDPGRYFHNHIKPYHDMEKEIG